MDWDYDRLKRHVECQDKELRAAKEARSAWHSEPRLVALGEVFAAEADNDAGVIAFRREVLHGTLLKPEGVWPWVERQAKNPDNFKFDDVKMISSHPASITMPDDSIISPSEGSPLGRFSRIAQNLTIRCGWGDDAAREFLLCGIPPLLGATYAVEYGARLEWINLRVPVTFGAREVAEMYSEARQEAWQSIGIGRVRSRTRRVNEETAERAVFVAKHNTGKTWREVLDLWNAEHEPPFSGDWRGFQKALSQAYRQVTWQSLEWKGGHARMDKEGEVRHGD